jgi:4-amino-4-deoxy-L-arabinose transferase-like glycosyltransferase
MSTLLAPSQLAAHPAQRARVVILLAAAAAVFLALVATFWVGVLGSDDSIYWDGASGWLAHLPYVGQSHWTLRHPLVIPIALARRLLGDGPAALVVPTLLYAIGCLVILGAWTARVAGIPAAAAALALVTTQPQFVLVSSTATIDISELFFILVAFALIHHAASENRPTGSLLLAGASLGVAMLCRETAAFAVVAAGLLFLAGFGFRRERYFLLGAGFVVPVGLETLFLWWHTGDPFYRQSIAVHHDSTIDRWVEQGSAVPPIHPAIDPIVMLLFNHNFGLLFWAAAPLLAGLFGRNAGPERPLLIILGTLAATWAVLAAGLWPLLPLTPRYYLLPSVLVAILCGIALARLWEAGRPRLAGAVGLALIGANLAALALDNRNFMFGERELAAIAARTPEPIHTDPQTLRRALLLLRWQHVDGRVTDAPPGHGDLFLYNPTRATLSPPAGWQTVGRAALPPSLGQTLIAATIGADHVSPALFAKLGRGHPGVTLYRVP